MCKITLASWYRFCAFFFNDTAATEIYTLSLHDALPIWIENIPKVVFSKSLEKVEWNNTRLIKDNIAEEVSKLKQQPGKEDRKSTRLNSSHPNISYAVFCLKKKHSTPAPLFRRLHYKTQR